MCNSILEQFTGKNIVCNADGSVTAYKSGVPMRFLEMDTVSSFLCFQTRNFDFYSVNDLFDQLTRLTSDRYWALAKELFNKRIAEVKDNAKKLTVKDPCHQFSKFTATK